MPATSQAMASNPKQVPCTCRSGCEPCCRLYNEQLQAQAGPQEDWSCKGCAESSWQTCAVLGSCTHHSLGSGRLLHLPLWLIL